MEDLKRLITNALSDESISPMAADELMSTLPKTSEEICECILARHKAGFYISEDKILCPVCRKIQPIKKTLGRNLYRKCPCCGEEIASFYRTDFMFTNIIFVCPPAVTSPVFLRVDMKCELVTENVEVKIKILSKEEGSISKFLINDSSWVTVPIRLYDTAKLVDAFKKHFKYSGCDAFKEKRFWIADSLTYCLLYMKYPYIELLLKTKYEYAISELITNYTDSGEKHFKRNFKDGKNLKEILPVPEWVFGEGLRLQELNEARILYNKYKPTKEAYERFLQLNLHKNELTIFKQILAMRYDGKPLYTFEKLVTYIERCDMYQAIYPSDCIVILRDYLNMSITSDTLPDTNSNSLKREHDITARNYKLVINKIQEEKFIITAKTLKKYEYGNSKYIVVVPETPQDLINEGRNNRNCVGSYIQSFSNGKSNIFFIRRKETPNTSYVTLEMRGSKITQAYLSSNRTITDKQTLAFIDEWQEHLKKEKIIIDHTK